MQPYLYCTALLYTFSVQSYCATVLYSPIVHPLLYTHTVLLYCTLYTLCTLVWAQLIKCWSVVARLIQPGIALQLLWFWGCRCFSNMTCLILVEISQQSLSLPFIVTMLELILLARPTEGTSLYVSLRQLVSQCVSVFQTHNKQFQYNTVSWNWPFPARAYTTLVVLV